MKKSILSVFALVAALFMGGALAEVRDYKFVESQPTDEGDFTIKMFCEKGSDSDFDWYVDREKRLYHDHGAEGHSVHLGGDYRFPFIKRVKNKDDSFSYVLDKAAPPTRCRLYFIVNDVEE